MSSTSTRKIEGFAAIGSEAPWLNPHKVVIVGLDVERNANNWFAFCSRAREPLDPEFVDDVRRRGVVDPIDVYKDGNTCIKLEGGRRVRSARVVWDEQAAAGVPEAQRIKVRVIPRAGTPEQLLVYNVGSDNHKLVRSTTQRAELMQNAVNFGMDVNEVASAFACHSMTVRNMLKLLSLSAKVQRAVDEGFALREAIKLADQPRERQDEVFEKMRSEDALRGARASGAIAAAKRGEDAKIGREVRRMRSRVLLERVREVAKKRENLLLEEVVLFVLGGPPPKKGLFAEALAEAGFKQQERKRSMVSNDRDKRSSLRRGASS